VTIDCRPATPVAAVTFNEATVECILAERATAGRVKPIEILISLATVS